MQNLFPDPEPEFVSDVQLPSTRGASPAEGIAVEYRKAEEESPITTPSFSPPGKNVIPGVHDSRGQTVESSPFLVHQPLNFASVNQPNTTFPSQGGMGEAEQIEIIAANEEYLGNNKREIIDQLFTSMRNFSEFGRSRASTGKSTSPAESTAITALDDLDSISARTLSYQHCQQSTSPGNGGIAGHCLPERCAGVEWPSPQKSTTVGTADPVIESLNQDGDQISSATSSQTWYGSPCTPREVKNHVSKHVSHESSTSNERGLWGSSPVEINDESENQTFPGATALKGTSMPANQTSQEAGKLTNESTNNATGVQSRVASFLSPTSNNLHNLLCGEADNRTAVQQPQQTITKKPQAPSTFQPQDTCTQYSPLPVQRRIYTNDSPGPQLPPIRGSTGWKPYTPILDQPRTPTSANSRPNNSSTFSSQQSTNERLQSPPDGETLNREMDSRPPRAHYEIQSSKPSGPNGDTCSVEGQEDILNQWRPKDASISKSNDSKNSAQAPHTPPWRSHSEDGVLTSNVLPQDDESAEHSLHKTSSAYQTTAQTGDGLGQNTSAVSASLDPTISSAPVKHAESQRTTDEQSIPRSSEIGQSSETLLSTAREFPGSLTMDSCKTACDTLRHVDDFIIKERGNVAQEETSPESTSHPKSSSNPSHQDSRPQSPTAQETHSQCQEATSPPHYTPLLSTAKTPIEPASPIQDLIHTPQKTLALAAQALVTPPAETSNSHRRNGSYAFIPPPIPFSPYTPSTNPPPTSNHPPALLSTDTRLATTSNPLPTKPTLTLIIDSADGNMSLDTTHPFSIVKNCSLSEFFQFYASVSGTPLSSLNSLKFIAAFGNNQTSVVRRYGGESAWKRLKVVMPTLFTDAVREDREGQMEWQVLVRGE